MSCANIHWIMNAHCIDYYLLALATGEERTISSINYAIIPPLHTEFSLFQTNTLIHMQYAVERLISHLWTSLRGIQCTVGVTGAVSSNRRFNFKNHKCLKAKLEQMYKHVKS